MEFDEKEAYNLLENLDVNTFYEVSGGNSITLFEIAVKHNNIQAVRFLFKNGLDYSNEKISGTINEAFWKLQYTRTPKEIDYELFEMAQTILECGVDPNKIVQDGEDIFSWTAFRVFNDFDFLWNHRSRYFLLLVAYGGSSNYCRPEIYEKFDTSNLNKYQFHCYLKDDGYHVFGEIEDEAENIIAII